MTNTVAVIGSINVDSILHIQALPQPGETIAMDAFSKAAGGKGANQAVAAARAGANTSFIGRVGDDANADFMLTQLKDNGIATTDITKTPNQQTGQAYILLQASGQNSIIVQAGANFDLTEADIEAAKATIQAADFVVAQFETPIPAAIAAFKLAHAAGKLTVLNPAPAKRDIPEELLQVTDLIMPNETESEVITGIPVTDEASMAKNAAYYQARGIAGVIITLGSTGSYVATKDVQQIVPAFKVKAVDTTAAGDTFIGALSAELKPDLSNLVAAVRYASKSSSFTVQTLGAFPSIPTRAVVAAALAADK